MSVVNQNQAHGRTTRQTVCFGIGALLALASVLSAISLIDFGGDAEPAGLLRTVFPLVLGFASATGFAIGGYIGVGVISVMTCVVFYAVMIFGATIFFGP